MAATDGASTSVRQEEARTGERGEEHAAMGYDYY